MGIAPTAVRYIKLGRAGSWEDAALDGGKLHFGYRDAPHELSLTCDFNKIREYLISQGRAEGAATRDAREIFEFYGLDENCLWITFAREHLWWAFASPEVTWIGGDDLTYGDRTRDAIGGWHNTDVNGEPLAINTLSTRLTKVAAYRRTICKVEAQDYVLRRINGQIEPLVAESMGLRSELLDLTNRAIRSLHQGDFETLVDIIFARSGWNRVSALGKTQKLIDMEIEQPTTQERGAVQVKSAATQRTLDDYIAEIDEAERFDRFFFICHTPKGKLMPPADRSDIHVWTGRELAAAVLRAGLQDWVFEKIA
jgi:hypothetical protein